MYTVREAVESDVERIREVIVRTYGEDYAFPQFYDLAVLKRMIYSDDTLLLVAEDPASGTVMGTASVIFDVGAHADQVGEFGRLMVDPDYRRRGIGKLLLQRRLDLAADRLHVALVEPRLLHPFSQKNVVGQNFAPVGLLPLELRLQQRESVGLCVRYFNDSLRLRRNHPHIIPEAHALARQAMLNCGIECDAIVDDSSPPYAQCGSFSLEEMTSEGYLPLLHIERGRVENREILGPMRLHYGTFKLRARKARYLVVRDAQRVVAAVGLIVNTIDKSARIFELIAVDDEPIRFVLQQTCQRCRSDWGMDYLSVDVSAFAPRMQRTLLELGFVPVAFVPAMVFDKVERLDVIRMVQLMVPPKFDNVDLIPEMAPIADLVMRSFVSRHVLPAMGRAIGEASLFHGLSPEQLHQVAAACRLRSFRAGDVVFREGDRDDHLYLVLRGCIAIDRHQAPDRIRSGASLGTVEHNETLGEMSLLAASEHFATATAKCDVEAATISHDQICHLARARPDIGVVLYRNLAAGLSRKLRRSDLANANSRNQ